MNPSETEPPRENKTQKTAQAAPAAEGSTTQALPALTDAKSGASATPEEKAPAKEKQAAEPKAKPGAAGKAAATPAQKGKATSSPQKTPAADNAADNKESAAKQAAPAKKTAQADKTAGAAKQPAGVGAAAPPVKAADATRRPTKAQKGSPAGKAGADKSAAAKAEKPAEKPDAKVGGTAEKTATAKTTTTSNKTTDSTATKKEEAKSENKSVAVTEKLPAAKIQPVAGKKPAAGKKAAVNGTANASKAAAAVRPDAVTELLPQRGTKNAAPQPGQPASGSAGSTLAGSAVVDPTAATDILPPIQPVGTQPPQAMAAAENALPQPAAKPGEQRGIPGTRHSGRETPAATQKPRRGAVRRVLSPLYMVLYHFVFLIAKIVVPLVYPVRVLGRHNLKKAKKGGHGYVVGPNHISAIDPMFVLLARGFAPKMLVMGKDELFGRNFLLDFFWRIAGTFPVRRGRGDTDTIDDVVMEVQKGRSLLLFPEGTRSHDGTLGRLKSGAFVVAMRTGSAMVPCHIQYREGRPKAFRRVSVAFGKPVTMKQLGLDGDYSPAKLRRAKEIYAQKLQEVYIEYKDRL